MVWPDRLSSAGGEAVDLAASAGLILDDWQRWCLDGALGEDANGRWSAFESCVLVPRQNGKGALLAAREMAGLVLFGEKLLIHSAHQFQTAIEHFRRMRELIEMSDDFRSKVRRIFYASGQESIEMKSGARLRFVARSDATARGFSADCLILDEAFRLGTDAMGAMLPSLSAVDNPQIWYASSAPHSDSHVLHALRKRALSGESSSLFFAEWGADSGVDADDRSIWAACNPAFGTRIREDFVANERETMRPLGGAFERERLGVAEMPDGTVDVFGAGAWDACKDERSRIVGDVCLALDVSHDLRWASIAASGRSPSGLRHIELSDHRPETDWVIDRVSELAKHHVATVAIDSKSPAAVFIEPLIANGVTVFSPSGSEYLLACARMRLYVAERRLVHIGQRPLDVAVRSAVTRAVGDGWVWARARSSADISGLVAGTLALWSGDDGKRQAPKLSEMVW